MMKKNFIIALIFMCMGSLVTLFILKKPSNQQQIISDTELIAQQMKNVSKLVVNEANISQIYNYKDQKSFLNLVSFNKKALVIVNADIQIMYDLSKLEYLIDETTKTVRITSIPKEEIKINPDIKIYDIEASRFNAFRGSDYNEIQQKVKNQFNEMILSSNIQENAKERLISELGKFLVVTQSLGWSLEYQENKIIQLSDFESFMD